MAEGGIVIAGTAKGTRLAAPGEGTRPLTARVKQSLFGAVDPLLADGPFLDLFAGSGAAGIEALSRGSPRAVFVERDDVAARVIRRNLERARLAERATVTRADALRYLSGDPNPAGGPFAIVFLDPPYGDAALGATLASLGREESGWVAARGIVVAKHFWRDAPPPDTLGALRPADQRRFGDTVLTTYRRRP